MILEKRSLVLLILALYFLCVFCDNDDAFTMQGTTIAMSAGSSLDFGSTKNVASTVTHDPESTKNPTSLVSDDVESTQDLTRTVNDESTTKLQTTDSSWKTKTTDDGGSPSSTVTHTTKFTTTTFEPEDVTSADNSTMICDPITWPRNASTDTREVLKLIVVSKSTEWIALSWESPCANATNVSVVYSVERYDGENYNQSNETTTRHNATNLDPCTQYTFIVKVLTEFWTSNGSNLTETTEYVSEIGNVLNLTRNVSVNIIELVWEAPAVHARCVSNYSITQCNDGSPCSEIIVSATNYIASNLEPCTEYHFTVKTNTPTVESTGVNDTAKTTSPKLSVPRSLKVTSGNFSLNIEWEPPETGATCLKHYRVTIRSNVESIFTTTDTNITIPQLHACVLYQVYLTAVNENDGNGDTAITNGSTLNSKTNPPVFHQDPSYKSTLNSILIMWSIHKQNNHCLLSTIVAVCNCTARNGTGYETVDGVSRTDINSRNATIITEITNVTGLSPFTSYVCSAYTIGDEDSDRSELVYAITSQDVPSEPIVSVKDNEDSWFFLTWKSPTRMPGILEEYELTLEWESLYPIPSGCPKKEPEKPIKLYGSTCNYNHTEARAFANYTVWMKAKTGAGWGSPSEPLTFHTKYGVPEAITKMSSPIIRPNPDDANVLDTILTWSPPCLLNGVLEGYIVSVHGTREKYKESHNFSVMHTCTEYILNNNTCSINLNELKGEYNYTFEISAKVLEVDTHGPSESRVMLYPAGIPPQPRLDYIQAITIDPYKARRSTTTVTVLLPFFLNTNGDIKYYAVMVAMVEHNKQSRARFDLNANDVWPETSAWKEAVTNNFATAYQATWKKWKPNPDQIADYGHIRAIEYTVGEDITCKDLSSRTDKPMYCNGPLKPNTWYHVRIRAFTNGGYTDSAAFLIKTNSEQDVALVVGAVFGILVVGILVTMMLLVRKCSPYIVLRRFLHSDMPGSPVPAPFTRKKFISHCQQLIDNPGKLSNEFRLLQTLSVDLQMPTNTACLQANRKKNRYSDILPYDFSRVKLEVIDNDPNTDYINASFIRGYTGEDEYIACQGPKEETTYDFWRMVDQYNINIIVMLTQLVEKGKEKCHQYYPTIRETFRYENMTIRCTSELDYRTHTQRTLVLQKENKKRNITHLHFKDWPDHDVPEDFDAMINFCQIIRRNISANKGFIVVHCSAGIGRTGTLITIDILLQHLRDNRKLDVFGTVYRLRHHRINMVQRESQYAYIYNCIKQVLKNPYFLKTYKPPPVDPVYEKADISQNAKDTMNSDMNLVNNLEILKSTSTESICNHSSRSTVSSTARHQKSATIRGLRHYRSMGVINVKTHHNTLGRSRTLDCVFYKSLRGSSEHELNRKSVTQESLPLLICSRSDADVLDDSVQSADGQHVKETIEL